VRPKRDSTPAERLEELLKAPIFADIPEADFAKLVIVAGDMMLPNLGISEEVTTSLFRSIESLEAGYF
jgi:hypothetical protein